MTATPVNRWKNLLRNGNFLLLLGTVIAFIWANSPAAGAYNQMLALELGAGPLRMSLGHWVNDLLMAFFFLLVGLELKDELTRGELRRPAKAMLAVFGALGGMIVPALIYVAFNAGGPGQNGWGIPMATDIAFALACITVLGRRVPAGVKVFLMALAIVDDLGAIIVIAVFYNTGIGATYLLLAGVVIVALLLLNRRGVQNLAPYLLLGVALWYVVLQSGVHATIAGVLLAFTIPVAPAHRLGTIIGPWVGRLVLPVFALFNAGLSMAGVQFGNVTMGAMLGLVVGKPIGVTAMAWLAVKLRLAQLPEKTGWGHLLGAGMIAGVGFTMALFIAGLAFDSEAMFNQARLGVFIGSIVAAAAGVGLMLLAGRRTDDKVISL